MNRTQLVMSPDTRETDMSEVELSGKAGSMRKKCGCVLFALLFGSNACMRLAAAGLRSEEVDQTNNTRLVVARHGKNEADMSERGGYQGVRGDPWMFLFTLFP